jgi:hypothetical protein
MVCAACQAFQKYVAELMAELQHTVTTDQRYTEVGGPPPRVVPLLAPHHGAARHCRQATWKKLSGPRSPPAMAGWHSSRPHSSACFWRATKRCLSSFLRRGTPRSLIAHPRTVSQRSRGATSWGGGLAQVHALPRHGAHMAGTLRALLTVGLLVPIARPRLVLARPGPGGRAAGHLVGAGGGGELRYCGSAVPGAANPRIPCAGALCPWGKGAAWSGGG